MKKAIRIAVAVAAVAGAAVTVSATTGQAGNGAPSGGHYNLNLIGVPKGKTASMTGSNRHTIFVPATTSSVKINLCQSGTSNCAPDDTFKVLDGNATDSNGGLFALPSPDPTPGDGIDQCTIESCTTKFSVYARILGKPGGSYSLTSCYTDSTGNWCSVGSGEMVTQTRSGGKSTFTNVSKQMLTICFDLDSDGDCDTREYLFERGGEGYYWEMTTDGFKLAQLRFYHQETCWGTACVG